MNHPPPATAPPGHLASPYVPAPRTGELHDWSGRRYLVGRPARELAGTARAVPLARAVAAVAAVGGLQFGYGAAVPLLVAAHGWSPAAALLPFALWALVQGGSAWPIARLRERGLLTPARAIVAGAPLCAAALAAPGLTAQLGWMLAAYGLAGGLGAGLVYHSSVHVVAAWYPERPASHAAWAGAGFALGAVPLTAGLVLAEAAHLAAAPWLGAALACVVAAAGIGLRTPPAHWWPPETDPRAWALRRRNQPVAAFDHSPAQAWRSGALPGLHAVVALAGAAALVDVAVLPLLLFRGGLPAWAIAAAMGVLVASSGLGRAAAGRWGERMGRRRILVAALTAGGAAQFGLAAAALTGSWALLLLMAVPAGVGGGCCYPLTRTLAHDFFGSRDSAEIPGLVYSAKALGGLLGVGGAAALISLVPQTGPALCLGAAGLAGLGAAAVAARLRRPVPIRTLPV
ncbi:MFS transporter [Streptomonospora litoralis]|uniref:Major Facilitator Superfamily protein n=1 Tax=Streptomonospora litoralis TaxID=2498135 RepID=A0A4P6Q613_9ACTN|nr:MFS transporter [Streptomonospora litoralis]QBI54217.1 Major Facilitator Superfamily protein [Streptomonospora litoralis]